MLKEEAEVVALVLVILHRLMENVDRRQGGQSLRDFLLGRLVVSDRFGALARSRARAATAGHG